MLILSFLVAVIGKPFATNEYAPCLDQPPSQPQQASQLQRGSVVLAPSCRQLNLQPAQLDDWPSMSSAYSLLQDNQLSAARLACNRADCSVIVVNARVLIANVVSGVPRRLCGGMMELCTILDQQQSSVSTDTTTSSIGCPVSPSVCSATSTATPSVSNSQFAIVNVTAPFYMAQSVCSRMGMSLADVTIQNFLPAVDTVLQCVGARQKAWVASWNGDRYGNETCLALTVGDQSGGGAINPVANCAEPLPVLCQQQSTNTTTNACTDTDYAIIQGVTANDTTSACSSLNMTPVEVTPGNARAISRALLNCPHAVNQTAWVSSYQSRKVIKAVECGCLGVAVMGPGRLVAVRPLFECQCQERRAVICAKNTQSPSATQVPQSTSQVSQSTQVYQSTQVSQPRPTPALGYGATLA